MSAACSKRSLRCEQSASGALPSDPRLPRIDQLDGDIFKTVESRVAKRDVPADGDAGNLHIGRLKRTDRHGDSIRTIPRQRTQRDDRSPAHGRRAGRSAPSRCQLQARAAAGSEAAFHARAQLRDRYRCGQERAPWLTIGPRTNRRIGRVLDQLGNDVRVEDDHFLEGISSYSSASKSGRLISHRELNSAIPLLKRLTSSRLEPDVLEPLVHQVAKALLLGMGQGRAFLPQALLQDSDCRFLKNGARLGL